MGKRIQLEDYLDKYFIINEAKDGTAFLIIKKDSKLDDLEKTIEQYDSESDAFGFDYGDGYYYRDFYENPDYVLNKTKNYNEPIIYHLINTKTAKLYANAILYHNFEDTFFDLTDNYSGFSYEKDFKISFKQPYYFVLKDEIKASNPIIKEIKNHFDVVFARAPKGIDKEEDIFVDKKEPYQVVFAVNINEAPEILKKYTDIIDFGATHDFKFYNKISKEDLQKACVYLENNKEQYFNSICSYYDKYNQEKNPHYKYDFMKYELGNRIIDNEKYYKLSDSENPLLSWGILKNRHISEDSLNEQVKDYCKKYNLRAIKPYEKENYFILEGSKDSIIELEKIEPYFDTKESTLDSESYNSTEKYFTKNGVMFQSNYFSKDINFNDKFDEFCTIINKYNNLKEGIPSTDLKILDKTINRYNYEVEDLEYPEFLTEEGTDNSNGTNDSFDDIETENNTDDVE
jgi:hypothetical protein